MNGSYHPRGWHMCNHWRLHFPWIKDGSEDFTTKTIFVTFLPHSWRVLVKYRYSSSATWSVQPMIVPGIPNIRVPKLERISMAAQELCVNCASPTSRQPTNTIL